MKSIPSCCATYEKLGISLNEQKILAGVAVDAIFDSVSVGTTMKEELSKLRNHLLLVRRSGSEPSRARREVSRHRRSAQRQLLRGAERGRVQRWIVLLRAEGREVPDGAVDLLPHQQRGHGTVRAHADHRRRRRIGELSRRLHRSASATRTSCTRRSSS